MKRILTALTVIMMMAAVVSCGRKTESEGQLPTDFSAMGDQQKVAWMMQHVPADSVARFICDASLGKIEGIKIDTLAMATLYAYEHYRESDLAMFSDAYDNRVAELSLPDKMKMYAMAGEIDPQALGYELGLEYVGSIRDNHKSADEVTEELKAFKTACGEDTTTYRRFIIGFKTVLRVDSGKDISREVYNRFINLE